jgi:Uma2 family endonuclease
VAAYPSLLLVGLHHGGDPRPPEEEAMTTISTKLTVAALQGYPEGDGNRYELIEGELHVTSQPRLEHQMVADAVLMALALWSEQHEPASLAVSAPGIILADDEAFAPDVVWYSAERLAAHRRPDGKFHGPPDLAVEVLSKGVRNERRDRVLKPARYAFWGVREYWLVDRFARSVQVYRLDGPTYALAATLTSADTLSSPNLPGFAAPVRRLFAKLPPESSATEREE